VVLQKLQMEKKNLIVTNEKKIHEDSFSKLKKEIKKRFPKLKVELNLIALDSKITKF
jgi:carbonic anhydrase